jgi:signal peptidase
MTARRKSGEPIARTLLRFIGLGLSGGLLLLILGLGAVLVVVPRVAGAIPLTVLTTSMEPLLPPGTMLFVLPVEMDDIAIGDVVTYQIRSGDPAVITHRVIEISSADDGSSTLTLLGDNNGSPDPDPVVEEQVKGRLWYSVPYIGLVSGAVHGENRAWIIPLVASALLAYCLFMVVSGVVAAVKARRKKHRL